MVTFKALLSLHHVVQSTPQFVVSPSAVKPDEQVEFNSVVNGKVNRRSAQPIAIPITILIPPPLPGENKNAAIGIKLTTVASISTISRITLPPVTKPPKALEKTTRLSVAPTTKTTPPTTTRVTTTTRTTSSRTTRITLPSISKTTTLPVKRPTLGAGAKKLTGRKIDGFYVHDNRGAYKPDDRGKYKPIVKAKNIQKLL